MRDRRESHRSPEDRGFGSPRLEMLRWRGVSLYYRPGTIDTELIYKILLKPEAACSELVNLNMATVEDRIRTVSGAANG